MSLPEVNFSLLQHLCSHVSNISIILEVGLAVPRGHDNLSFLANPDKVDRDEILRKETGPDMRPSYITAFDVFLETPVRKPFVFVSPLER
jgi:hypothetical protein